MYCTPSGPSFPATDNIMISEGKAADADVQREVDELTLDYILYEAIRALVEDGASRTKKQNSANVNHLSAETNLALVDCEHQ